MSNYLRAIDMKDKSLSSPCGDRTRSILQLKDNELVDTGKVTDIQAEIDSHLNDVLISKVVERCIATGESLIASQEAFGDATKVPKSLLDLHEEGQKVQAFVDGLSDVDLSKLNDVGFDSFIKEKIEAKAAELAALNAVKQEGGDKLE